MSVFGSRRCVRLAWLACALLLTWLSAHTCHAQQAVPVIKAEIHIDARSIARSELANLKAYEGSPLLKVERAAPSPWLIAAASTTAAFAASYAFLGGYSYKAGNQAARALQRSQDYTLDFETRLRASEQATSTQSRADLLSRVSDVVLAGTVATAGATLLIWLTSKRKRQEQQIRSLIGPMVLRGANGGGLVLRQKF